MIRMNSRLLRLLALMLALAMLGVACGDDDDDDAASDDTEEPASEEQTAAVTPAGGPDTVAAVTRTTLQALFQEHVMLAASATGAALGARNAEFEAAAAALDANSEALTTQIERLFGADKGFGPLWKNHIGFVVEYTKGVAANDKAIQDKAVAELLLYATRDFGGFINSILPGLAPDVVGELVKTHILTLKDVIDAQAAKDQPKAYNSLRTAAEHMGAVAEPLASAIAAKFPKQVPGDPKSAAAALLNSLNIALREHTFLAAAATGGALGGRQDEFMAAAGALEANSNAITELVGSVYGADAGKAFDTLWKTHITFFVDYTTGLAGGDQAKQDKAVADLIQYASDFGAFLSSATPELPKETVAELVKTHILTLKSVVDAQAAKNPAQAYTNLRQAVDHMIMIAQPLAGAIVKQFSDRFPGA